MNYIHIAICLMIIFNRFFTSIFKGGRCLWVVSESDDDYIHKTSFIYSKIEIKNVKLSYPYWISTSKRNLVIVCVHNFLNILFMLCCRMCHRSPTNQFVMTTLLSAILLFVRLLLCTAYYHIPHNCKYTQKIYLINNHPTTTNARIFFEHLFLTNKPTKNNCEMILHKPSC